MTDYADDRVDGLAVALDGGVLRLTLDRPEKRNAIDDAMMRGLDRRRRRGRRPTSACA